MRSKINYPNERTNLLIQIENEKKIRGESLEGWKIV